MNSDNSKQTETGDASRNRIDEVSEGNPVDVNVVGPSLPIWRKGIIALETIAATTAIIGILFIALFEYPAMQEERELRSFQQIEATFSLLDRLKADFRPSESNPLVSQAANKLSDLNALDGLKLKGVGIKGLELPLDTITRFGAHQVYFRNAKFSSAFLNAASFEHSKFQFSDMRGLYCSNCELSGTIINWSNLDDADFALLINARNTIAERGHPGTRFSQVSMDRVEITLEISENAECDVLTRQPLLSFSNVIFRDAKIAVDDKSDCGDEIIYAHFHDVDMSGSHAFVPDAGTSNLLFTGTSCRKRNSPPAHYNIDEIFFLRRPPEKLEPVRLPSCENAELEKLWVEWSGFIDSIDYTGTPIDRKRHLIDQMR